MLLAAMHAAQPVAAQETDSAGDWMGAAVPSSSLAVRAGADNEDQTILGVDGVFTLPNYGQISADYARSEVDVDGSSNRNRYWSLAYGSDPLANWSAGLGYQHSGSDSSVDTDDWQLWGQYFPGQWSLLMALTQGEVSADNPLAGGIFNRPATLNFDRQGISLSYTLFLGAWSLGLSASAYDYEDDFPAQLANRRLGLFIAQQSLAGLYDLVDNSVAANVSYQTQQWGAQVALASYDYALTGGDEKSISVGGNYYVIGSVSVSAQVVIGLEDDIRYGETALRWHW